ncbi:MAG: hypothetical protein R3B94_15090 [Hyphomonas sp.]
MARKRRPRLHDRPGELEFETEIEAVSPAPIIRTSGVFPVSPSIRIDFIEMEPGMNACGIALERPELKAVGSRLT